jgi:hypothetical protein
MASLEQNSIMAEATWNNDLFHNHNYTNLKKNNFETIGNLANSLEFNYRTNTILGLRNGVQQGQEQSTLYDTERQLKPYVRGMTPFPSTKIHDIMMPIYGVNPIGGSNGYLPNMASAAGAPLAYAIDDITILQDRMHKERYRLSSNDVLGAQFALDTQLQQLQRLGQYSRAAANAGLLSNNHIQNISKQYVANHPAFHGHNNMKSNILGESKQQQIQEKNHHQLHHERVFGVNNGYH